MIIFTGLKFNKNFRKNADENFEKKQKYIDSEVLRYSDKYIPKRNGKLIESGISGTVVGSGKVEYTTPYSRKQYYENAGKGVEGMNKTGGGLRGKMWFERMKADHKKEILRGLEKIK